MDQPEDRPWQITAAVSLFGLVWSVGLVSMVLGPPSRIEWDGPSIAAAVGLGLWTLLIGYLLRRLWRGGPIVWWFLSKLGTGLGAIYTVGVFLMFLAHLAMDGEFSPVLVATPLPAVALLTAGLLLRTAPARAWCHRAGLPDSVPGPSLFGRRSSAEERATNPAPGQPASSATTSASLTWPKSS